MMPESAIVGVGALLIVGVFLRSWLTRRYRAGQIRARTALWIYLASVVTPYVLLLAIAVGIDATAAPLVLLLLIVTLPLMVAPAVEMFRTPVKR